MEIDDPAALLYDAYTLIQLKEIARHNNVQTRSNATKLQVAKAIVEQTDEKYEIPKRLTLPVTIRSSRLKALRGEAAHEHKDEQRRLMREQYEAVLSPEELEDNPNYKKIIRFIEDEDRQDPQEKIAVYSNRNLYWDVMGHLKKGYSFITREEANKWLQLSSVREATPQEVADHFNL